MFIITREIAAPPANRQLDNVDEEVGTSAEDLQQSRRPSYSMSANPPSLENHAPDDSSSPNPLANLHGPPGIDVRTRGETADNNNSASSSLRGEAPPPYVEAVDQREVDHR
jgi:hypothetical protein